MLSEDGGGVEGILLGEFGLDLCNQGLQVGDILQECSVSHLLFLVYIYSLKSRGEAYIFRLGPVGLG